MPEYILARHRPLNQGDSLEVLSRIGVNELHWADIHTAEHTAFRYAVRYPSIEAAEKGALIYGAKPQEV